MRTSLFRRRAGFSLLEIIVALTILSIIGVSLTRLVVSQTRGYQSENGGRRARSAARSAMNVLVTDLRMTQDQTGLTALDATYNKYVDVKVPVAFGLVCKITLNQLVVALAPVDSFQLNTMKYAGYAVRGANGAFAYAAGGTMTSTDRSQCHGGPGAPNITADTITVAGRPGSVVLLAGLAAPPGGTAVGSIVFVWQNVKYIFRNSGIYPGRTGLFRIATGAASGAAGVDTSELIAPFNSSARFSYYTNPAQLNDTAATTAPVDLTTVRGLKIYLPAEAPDTVVGRNGPQKTSLTTAVFFKNTRNQ